MCDRVCIVSIFLVFALGVFKRAFEVCPHERVCVCTHLCSVTQQVRRDEQQFTSELTLSLLDWTDGALKAVCVCVFICMCVPP